MDKKAGFVDPIKKIREAQEKRAAYLELVRKSFQVVAGTEAGQVVIEYLMVESRAFANGLKAVSNLHKVYGFGPEYFLGQSDFGKNLMQFLTLAQVAELIQKTQKEDENERK